jgi:hypothetical protein
MALTQQQWYTKLKGFVPSWWFEKQQYAVAYFNAMAAVFAQVDQDSDDQKNAVFLTRSTTPILDLSGEEQGEITRMGAEQDPSYVTRIQRITSATDPIDIKTAVDELLAVGQCLILEAPIDNAFCSRGTFCSRDSYISDFFRNFFAIVVQPQEHKPYSFAARGNFCSRSDFYGTTSVSGSIYASIVATVNAMKADGVMYSIIESDTLT